MTDAPLPSHGTARELLATTRALSRRVRSAQRVTWLPLLILAVITLAVIPLYRFAPRHIGACRSGPRGTSVCTSVIPAVLVYWPIALVLAYSATAGFYARQSRKRGVGTLIRPYVVVGVALAVLLAAASLWRAFHPLIPGTGTQILHPASLTWHDLLTPVVAMGLGLLILAWVERNRPLLAYAVVYLVVVLVQARQIIHASSQWSFLPQLLIPAALLLLGSGGFAVLAKITKLRSR